MVIGRVGFEFIVKYFVNKYFVDRIYKYIYEYK